jgi:hypothetical protein
MSARVVMSGLGGDDLYQLDGLGTKEELRSALVELIAGLSSGPWRFDVPEVPAHVTAMEVEGCLIVRVLDMLNVPGGWWKQRFSDGTVDNAKPLSVWLQYAPLVECEDPRAAS